MFVFELYPEDFAFEGRENDDFVELHIFTNFILQFLISVSLIVKLPLKPEKQRHFIDTANADDHASQICFATPLPCPLCAGERKQLLMRAMKGLLF